MNTSLMNCCMLCYTDAVCDSFNFEEVTRTCEFNNEAGYDGSERKEGWDVYYKTGKAISTLHRILDSENRVCYSTILLHYPTKIYMCFRCLKETSV